MARARVKIGGPTRGRRRIKKLGMNSGKLRGQIKKNSRGR